MALNIEADFFYSVIHIKVLHWWSFLPWHNYSIILNNVTLREKYWQQYQSGSYCVRSALMSAISNHDLTIKAKSWSIPSLRKKHRLSIAGTSNVLNRWSKRNSGKSFVSVRKTALSVTSFSLEHLFPASKLPSTSPQLGWTRVQNASH